MKLPHCVPSAFCVGNTLNYQAHTLTTYFLAIKIYPFDKVQLVCFVCPLLDSITQIDALRGRKTREEKKKVENIKSVK